MGEHSVRAVIADVVTSGKDKTQSITVGRNGRLGREEKVTGHEPVNHLRNQNNDRS